MVGIFKKLKVIEVFFLYCYELMPSSLYSPLLEEQCCESCYILLHFSRRFYPKRLTLHSSYSFTFLSALAFPGNRTHDPGFASAMLYHLSYRKVLWAPSVQNTQTRV